MNDKIYNLVMKILDSDLSKERKDEIVSFFILPRNTSVRPVIELPDEQVKEQLGGVKRAETPEELDRRRNPDKYEGEQAMADTLKGRIDR